MYLPLFMCVGHDTILTGERPGTGSGIVKICGVEKSPKIEKAEAFESVFRGERLSPERRETDAARVAALAARSASPIRQWS